MIRSRRRGLLLPMVVILGLSFSSIVHGEEPKPEPKALFDCGTIALYNLLRWEGHPVSLEELAASLPPCPSAGYSMKELRDAARAFGVRLEGIQLSGGTKAPDRPALAFLKNGDHGHYVVVRPVGHTGSLVQVADLDLDPSVVEASKLYGSTTWTGMVLTRDTTSLGRGILVAVALLGSAISAFLLYRGWKTGRNAVALT